MLAAASLPMYDWPEIRQATDHFWRALAKSSGLTGELVRQSPHDALWRDPALMFSQTCGYPFTHEFKGQLHYVATPHYACPGCEGPYYSSFIFTRGGDRSVAPIPAINSMDSMSGMLALKLFCAEQSLATAQPLITGSHGASLAAVQSGAADICAVDAVVVALAHQHRPELLRGLVEMGQSPMVPGLPFVTRAGDVAQMQEALATVFADEALISARKAMLMSGFSILPATAYDEILKLEATL